MKKYLAGKLSKENIIGDSNNYSIYTNPDEKLRAEIASFNIPTDVITLGWPEKEWKIIGYEEDEVKCQSGRNISYFPKKEIEQALSSNLEEKRNQKYQAYNYFKNAFGIISFFYDEKGYMKLRKIDLQSAFSTLDMVTPGVTNKVNTMSVQFYNNFYEYELSDIELTYREMGCTLNLYFNSDGDYVNRDYNENLNQYKCEDISPKILYESFKNKILKIGKLQHCKGKYYTDKYCFIPYFYEERGEFKLGVEKVPVRDDKKSYQEYSGQPIYKRPAKTDEVNSSHLWETILKLMPDEFALAFEINKVEEVVVKENEKNKKLDIYKGETKIGSQG